MLNENQETPEDESASGVSESDIAERREKNAHGSLADDLGAMYEDAQTYLEAELAFQKTRAGYAGHNVKTGAALALGAMAFLHLASLGLVVGLIIALAPILGAFGAMALMVVILLVIGGLLGWMAAKRFRRVRNAFDGDDTAGDER